jgi:hypothetical protein
MEGQASFSLLHLQHISEHRQGKENRLSENSDGGAFSIDFHPPGKSSQTLAEIASLSLNL